MSRNKEIFFGEVRKEIKKKVDWVSWRKICCSKECGGLGVKDISFLMTSYLQNRGGEFFIKPVICGYKLWSLNMGNFAKWIYGT